MLSAIILSLLQMSHRSITDQPVPVALFTSLLFTIGVGDVIGVRRSLVYHIKEWSCVNLSTSNKHVSYYFLLFISINIKKI